MRSFAALSLILLSVATSGLAIISVPLTKLQRTGAYLKGSPDADRARAAFFKSRKGRGPFSVPATNLQYVQYTTSVGIGKPPTYYNLIVDTGSSNTFCGVGKPYVRTSTSIPTGLKVNVTYGLGNFTGLEYLDQVTLAPGVVISNQSIGDALSSADFNDVDGIIGVGPVDLTLETLSSDKNATIPTVMNNLVSQGLVDKQILGVHFAPPTSANETNGALTFGGIDPCSFEGELTYAPLTKTSPSSLYWGINVTSATYGNHTIIPNSTAGIVDTGTTQVLLADDFLAKYVIAIPGAQFDLNTALIKIPISSVKYMQPLDFTIAGRVFTMDVAAQLIPEDQNIAWGGVPGVRYSVVGFLGSLSGEGLDFILGEKFMERYYAVFDEDAKRVGFARTNNTFTTDKA